MNTIQIDESFTDLYSIMYYIMCTISSKDIPIIFKGALVLKKANSNSPYSRETRDIDCD